MAAHPPVGVLRTTHLRVTATPVPRWPAPARPFGQPTYAAWRLARLRRLVDVPPGRLPYRGCVMRRGTRRHLVAHLERAFPRKVVLHLRGGHST